MIGTCNSCADQREVPRSGIGCECGGIFRVEADDTKPRYDEALLRKYLSDMPLGKYHASDLDIGLLVRDKRVIVATIMAQDDIAKKLVAALVHLLNAREQTEIPR